MKLYYERRKPKSSENGAFMKDDTLEVYVAKDIIQGEEVPFYVLWYRDDVTQIDIDFEGFECIVEYYNLRDDFSPHNKSITVNDLKTTKYFGGILKAPKSTLPYKNAHLNVCFRLSNGDKTAVTIDRILYNTNIEVVELPPLIKIPFDTSPIKIRLKGATTIFISIKSTDDSSLPIELPEDAQTAMEKMIKSITEGLDKLKEKYPHEHKKIEKIAETISLQRTSSMENLYERALEALDTISANKEFYSDLARIYEDAFLRDVDFLSLILVPILRYLQANPASKSFLMNPLLCVHVPKGGGSLRAVVSYKNIIEDVNSFNLETSFECQSDAFIPIKDLITIERVE